ncbi:glycosyltransferase [Acidisoma sp. C75]
MPPPARHAPNTSTARHAPDTSTARLAPDTVIARHAPDTPVTPQAPDAPSDWLLGRRRLPDRPEPLSLAIDAWQRAEAAFQASDFAAAEFWAERALRLGPNDTQVRFLLGMALLRQGKPRCFAIFEALAARSDSLPAHRGLIAAATFSQTAETIGRLIGSLLSRFAAPEDADFAPLASAVAARLGIPGWCAADDRGVVTVMAEGKPDFLLDGRPVSPRALGGGRFRLPPAWATARSLTLQQGGRALLGSPIDLTRHRLVEGFVEAAAGGSLSGWAWKPANPQSPVALTIESAGAAPPLRLQAREPTSFPDRDGLTVPRGFAVPAEALRGHAGRLLHVRDASGMALTGSPLFADPWRMAAASLLRGAAPAQPSGAGPRGRRRAAAVTAQPADMPLPSPPPLIPLWVDETRPERAPPGAGEQRGAQPARPRPGRARPRVAVIIPVYRGLAVTLRCIERVLAAAPRGMRLILVDDASPEPELSAALARLAAAQRSRVTLLRNPRNLGFPGSVNRGLLEAAGQDVVLLNSDALVPPGWIERLAAAAWSAADIGTVAPLSNEATILSYPHVDAVQPPPAEPVLDAVDRMAARANGTALVEIPTSVGFCMYIRADCLAETGLFREDLFAQGYGEENDFCMRARHLGWRHMGMPGLFVSHIGGQSFRAARQHLLRRNQALLERLHPGYGALVARHIAADPLAEARRRIDLLRWRARPRPPGPRASVILITHDEGGGVERQVRARAAALARQGITPILLKPAGAAGCRVELGLSPAAERGRPGGEQAAGEAVWRADFPNLVFRLPAEMPALLRLLRAEKPGHVELHHRLGHAPSVLGIAPALGLPMDIVVHDYAAICPRVTLVSTTSRYCGEPDLPTCTACIADLGSRLREEIGVGPLRERSRAEFAAARTVILPSAEVEARFRRYIPGLVGRVEPWEAEKRLAPRRQPLAPPAPGRPRRIAVIGAIGTEKGYDVLLDAARDAARRALPLEFVIVGYTHDDVRLIETGKARVTYRFAQAEAAAEIAAQQADIAFIPSIWPETWCFALSDAWAAGLAAAVFDIGTPAERVRRAGQGWVLPLALSASALNEALLSLA